MIIKMNLILGVVLMLVTLTFTTAQKEDASSFTESVISKIKSNDFDKINLKDYLRQLANHENKEETISAYLAIFNELKRRSNVNYNEAVVTLAFILRDLLNTNLSTKAADEAAQLKAALPESVRNLAFSKQVCIIASELNQHLYAANNDYIYLKYRRMVFTWAPGGRVTQGYWIIEPHNDSYYIKNTAHQEYLYSPGFIHLQLGGFRKLFTWVSNTVDDVRDQAEWTFKPIEDSVYIYNNDNEEYLFVDKNKMLDQNRTKTYTKKYREDEKLVPWRIEAC